MIAQTCRRVPALYMAVYNPRKRRPVKILICGYEGKPFEKTSVGYLLLIPFICVDETINGCTEQDHCLNSSCRFNKTTVETYARYHHEPKECIPRLKKRWAKLVKSMSDYCQCALKCMDAYKADPQKLRAFTIENGEIRKRNTLGD